MRSFDRQTSHNSASWGQNYAKLGIRPDEILKNVKEGIDDFVADAPQFDDITMIGFRYNGPQAQTV